MVWFGGFLGAKMHGRGAGGGPSCTKNQTHFSHLKKNARSVEQMHHKTIRVHHNVITWLEPPSEGGSNEPKMSG